MSAKQKLTAYRNLDLDETGVVVDATPVKVRTIFLNNLHATATRFVKFYNKVTAATSADTPVFTIPVAASILGGGIQVNLTHAELAFPDGLSLRATTGIADNDTGAPGANEVVVNLGLVENYEYTL
jgi:hypothetical protein